MDEHDRSAILYRDHFKRRHNYLATRVTQQNKGVQLAAQRNVADSVVVVVVVVVDVIE